MGRPSQTRLRRGRIVLVSLCIWLVFPIAFTAPQTLPRQLNQHLTRAVVADPVEHQQEQADEKNKQPSAEVEIEKNEQPSAEAEVEKKAAKSMKQEQADEKNEKPKAETKVQKAAKRRKSGRGKSPVARLKKRMEQLLGRDLKPEDLVITYQATIEVPGTSSIKQGKVTAKGASAAEASKEAANQLMLLLGPKLLEQEKAEKVPKVPKVPELKIGQKVMATFQSIEKGIALFKVLVEGKNISADMPAAEVSAAFPDGKIKAGETLEASVYERPGNVYRHQQTGKQSSNDVLFKHPYVLTLHQGNFTRELPDVSQETKDLFMALPQDRWLDADVVRETSMGGFVLEVKYEDGRLPLATGHMFAADTKDPRSMYPGKTIQVRVKAELQTTGKMRAIPVSMKGLKEATEEAGEEKPEKAA